MDPATIGSISMGATAGGGILSAFGSIMSGNSNKQMYDYQSGVAKLNAQIDRQNAEFASQEGSQENFQYGLKAGQRMGQITTAQAASGFDVRSGSAAQVIKSQGELNRVDMDTIRSKAAKTAYNYEEQASVADSQAKIYSMAGDNAQTAGLIGAGSSILGSAASVSNEWLQGNRVGLWNSGSGGGSAYGIGGYGAFGA